MEKKKQENKFSLIPTVKSGKGEKKRKKGKNWKKREKSRKEREKMGTKIVK